MPATGCQDMPRTLTTTPEDVINDDDNLVQEFEPDGKAMTNHVLPEIVEMGEILQEVTDMGEIQLKPEQYKKTMIMLELEPGTGLPIVFAVQGCVNAEESMRWVLTLWTPPCRSRPDSG